MPYIVDSRKARLLLIREQRDRLAATNPNRYSDLWQPAPENKPQQLAFSTEVDEIFYGGAGFGGKTDLACGLSIRSFQRVTIFRQTYQALSDIALRLQNLVPDTIGRYNDQKKTVTFSGNKFIALASLDNPKKDVRKHEGKSRDLLVFDEAQQQPEWVIDHLQAWNRSENPNQRTMTLLTGNPPDTPEGMWLLRRYGPWLKASHPNPAASGEVRYFYRDSKGVEQEAPDKTPIEVEINGKLMDVVPKSRTFIRATVDDNPWATQEYKQSLLAMPEALRNRMYFGIFKEEWDDDEWQVIPSEWVDLAMARWTDKPPENIGMSALGVDPARGGKDHYVMAPRYRNWFAPLISIEGAKTPSGQDGLNAIAKARKDQASVNIDTIGGAGSSVYDYCNDAGLNTHACVGSKSTAKMCKNRQLHIRNERALYYWRFREALDPESGQNIALPPDQRLKVQLCAHQWKYSSQGIQIVEKDQVKKIIGESPDRADAVVYANIHGIDSESSRGEVAQIGGYDYGATGSFDL